MQTVNITCDDGYIQNGTSASCSRDDVGKAKWTSVPTCEGVLEDCFYEALTYMRGKNMIQLSFTSLLTYHFMLIRPFVHRSVSVLYYASHVVSVIYYASH